MSAASVKGGKINKRVITLTCVLLTLVAVTAGYFILSGRAAKPQKAKTSIIFNIQAAYVNGITYTYGGEEIALEYVKSKWQYAADPSFPLDRTYPSYMASAISKIQATLVLDSTDDMAQFGLAEPEMSITVKTKQGNSYTFNIGAYNPYSEQYYFNIDGQSRVYMIAPGLLPYFSYSLYDMILFDELPAVTAENITSVVVAHGEASRTLEGDAAANAAGLVPEKCIDYKPTGGTLEKYGISDGIKVTLNYTEVYTVSDTAGAMQATTVESRKSFTYTVGGEYDESYTCVTAENSKKLYLVKTEALEFMR